MAVARKGWRPIQIASEEIFWRALGEDYGVKVVIVSEHAFERGSSQQLKFELTYGGLPQRTTVTPSLVRRAIEIGRNLRPPFTGGHGEEDVLLDESAVVELQALANGSA